MRLGTISAGLRHWGQAQPDAPALVWRDEVVSFGALETMSNDMIALIVEMHVHRGSLVSVAAVKNPETIALIAALNRSGYPVLIAPERMGTDAKRAVYERAGVAAEVSWEGRVFSTNVLHSVDKRKFCPFQDGKSPLVLTTSGSTGVPKGVCLSHGGISNFFAWAQAGFAIQPGRTVLSYAPLNFDLSLLEVWAALHAGATVVLADAEQAADGKALQQFLEVWTPDLIQGVPILYRLLLQAPRLCLPRTTDVILTGEAAAIELRQGMATAFPSARFHNVYGFTETNDSFIFTAKGKDFVSNEVLPIGHAIDRTRYKLVDDDGQTIEGEGTGELHTSTPFAALGYTDAGMTERAFYVEGENVFFRTGDLVERDTDGSIHLLGRRDFVVKIRGVRTNLRDVELALERNPAVAAAVACPVHDDAGDTIVHAVVQLVGSSAASSLALRRYCAELLPRSALPSRFSVTTDPLPRTSTGKPDRTAIGKSLATERVTENA